jgi:hypothetical protein
MDNLKLKAGDRVTAISLWEPWASLMREGAKTIETRSWMTEMRGPLLICAAKKRDRESLLLLNDPEFQRGLASLAGGRAVTAADLFFGHAVAMVHLRGCRRTETLLRNGLREEAFGDYSPGRWGWITDNLRLFTPFPVKGAQGLFRATLPEGFECFAPSQHHYHPPPVRFLL